MRGKYKDRKREKRGRELTPSARAAIAVEKWIVIIALMRDCIELRAALSRPFMWTTSRRFAADGPQKYGGGAVLRKNAHATGATAAAGRAAHALAPAAAPTSPPRIVTLETMRERTTECAPTPTRTGERSRLRPRSY
ncbi:hypothetical protein EVAR_75247_1 [Eumeta japonica]|uniref:Uncharacterized protein n=1 Tax=Eumeta variegata TaxID=151549 RepID=A0A4C1VAQ6_EUMVA|nr:hypothetical protein EVAR_75247_1 [Eumeta japonica]